MSLPAPISLASQHCSTQVQNTILRTDSSLHYTTILPCAFVFIHITYDTNQYYYFRNSCFLLPSLSRAPHIFPHMFSTGKTRVD